MLKVINIKALGYDKWIVYLGIINPPITRTIDHKGKTYHIHPFIKANKRHVDSLNVNLGEYIAGVRWED